MIYEWYIRMTYSKGNHAALKLGSGYPTCGHKFASFWEICKAVIPYFLFFISYSRNLKNLVLVWLLGCCSMFSICLKTILNMLVTGYIEKIPLILFWHMIQIGMKSPRGILIKSLNSFDAKYTSLSPTWSWVSECK